MVVHNPRSLCLYLILQDKPLRFIRCVWQESPLEHVWYRRPAFVPSNLCSWKVANRIFHYIATSACRPAHLPPDVVAVSTDTVSKQHVHDVSPTFLEIQHLQAASTKHISIRLSLAKTNLCSTTPLLILGAVAPSYSAGSLSAMSWLPPYANISKARKNTR